jgi:NhaP-type Na+/H+ or K+/H+ antiporter
LDPYILVLIGGGVLILLVAWLPMALKELPLSLPMICVALGFGLFHALGGEQPLPLRFPKVTERLTEMIVIVALMGSGLKLDRRLGWRSWNLTWRLLAISMPSLSLASHGSAMLGWVLAWQRRCCSGRCWHRPTRSWPRMCRLGRPTPAWKTKSASL